MEGQRAGVCPGIREQSKNSAASSEHNNFLPESKSSAEVVASSANDNFLPEKSAQARNALNGWSGIREQSKSSAEVAASSAHNNFLPEKSAHARNALKGSSGTREQSKSSAEVVAASAHNNFLSEKSAHDRNALSDALDSPGEAAGLREQSESSAEVVASSAHALSGTLGLPCEAAGHNESTDSRQHEAPPCEAIEVASSANNLEKAAHNRNDLCHTYGCIVKGSAEGSPCEAAGHNDAADSSQQQLASSSPPCGAEIVVEVKAKLKRFSWHGMQIALPAALCLCQWCSLDDEVLEFRGSNAALKDGLLLLESAALDLQFNIVDGALWLKMPSSQYSDMLPGPVSQLLCLWEKRSGLVGKYIASGSSGMIYNSNLAKLLIADCCIFDLELFAAAKIADSSLQHVVPRDLQAEVVFECVSATDNVKKIWDKCEGYIASNRAKMAIGICDRVDKKEVMVAYRDFHGDVKSEVQQDPRFIDLGWVLRGFRIYLSYMIPAVFLHFTVHHTYDLSMMPDDSLQLLLCSQIAQGGQVSSALAMEIVNGLGTLNFNDSMGRNPLVVGISTGNIEMVHYLLECKADPGFLDGDNVCALLYAKAHDIQIYDALRSASGRDTIFSMGDLLIALDKNSPKSFEMLLHVVLASGADIDEINEENGCTILSRAVSDGRLLWAVRMLIKAGACPTKADAKGVIPLKKAMFSLSEDELLESDILSATNMDMRVVRSMVVRGMVDDHPRILEITCSLIRE